MLEALDQPLTESNKQLNIADSGARFGNNLADGICFAFLIFLHAMILDGWLGVIPEGGSDWLGFYSIFLYVMYFTVFESLLGKTPGKFLTKTSVVKQDGSRPTFINCLGRNVARFIPFDAVSFLFLKRGWHDLISGTYVVYDEGRS